MKTRYFALIMGIAFLAVGILGFVPALLAPPSAADTMHLTNSYGHLFGLFPVNAAHNAVHLLFGIWGVVVWRNFTASRAYARTVTVVYVVLAVLGLFPESRTLFGWVPIYGHDIWLHGVIAIVAAYFGYAPVATVESASATGIRRP